MVKDVFQVVDCSEEKTGDITLHKYVQTYYFVCAHTFHYKKCPAHFLTNTYKFYV